MEWPADLLELLAAGGRDPRLLEATVRAARSRSPLVAELPEEETRRHTRALIDGAIDALVAGTGPGEEALRAAERLGADRARQGVPVTALLDGFQAGRSHIVQALVAEGRARGVPADLLLDGVTRLDAISTALSHRMVHAHRVAELEFTRTAREGRVQVLRRLLHGEPASMPAPFDPTAAYHCVVGEVGDPEAAGRLERALRPGLCGLVDGRFAALVVRPPDEVPADGPLLVVAPPAPVTALASRYQLARRALRAAGTAGLSGLHPLTGLSLLTAAAAEPELGGLLADRLLAGLAPGDPFHRELAETALAYLDHGGRIDPAAAALHVHPNTVKYRLRRLQELTGRSLAPAPGTAVAHTAHWWWALRCWLAPAR
ncbi:PucR family transcriptional regulator [Actinomadura craniellae]|uniref:PucR family transcriptional regulator n=1 Tax=Actinomadura craniellae TaxID=2231787 RepID=A0A365GWJ2_9ACTN|nr:helix-turn-helix domain-containing protein [Actinomadura craniellae]RAY11138.1 PucR family transcriptional regulator [Actinomadura craniellae]